MNRSNNYSTNEAAFREMKSRIDSQYPAGHYLAFDDGTIVADAPTYDELTKALTAAAKNRPDIFVVQAGRDYPQYADILTHIL